MSFTGDPLNSVTDRLRLVVGDTDELEEGYSDEVYQYVYDKNSGNENKASIEILRMLVAKYANYVTESAGKLSIKGSEMFDQYERLLSLLTKDPRTAITLAGVGFTGGISQQESDVLFNNPDARINPMTTAIPTNDTLFDGRF